MPETSIETKLELWASSLREVKRQMRPLFTQARVARSAENFLDGLLSENRRKNGWMRAQAAGDPGPWRQQAILGRGRWDADALRDVVRGYALKLLADDDAVLAVDETGFLKRGQASCGVARQYTASVGKITNCQIGVFACYVTKRGHAFIDRELYLPKSWTDDKARMAQAHVPQEIIESANGGFATKPALLLAMIERAIVAKVPFSFIAADMDYGGFDIETALRRKGRGYVLGVKPEQPFHSRRKPVIIGGTAAEIAERLPPSAWTKLPIKAGVRDQPVHDWAHVELADIDAGQYSKARKGEFWTRGLLIRRNSAEGELAFSATWAPQGTTLARLAEIEGSRRAMRDSFEIAKKELGLDHNETRSWHGWRRHVTLVMLAFATMAAIRVHGNAPMSPATAMRRSMTARDSRRPRP
jgi:SRSO17 transposase